LNLEWLSLFAFAVPLPVFAATAFLKILKKG